jgi:glycogen phosphorylase
MFKQKADIKWVNVYKDMTAKGIERSFLSKRQYSLAKDKYTATCHDNFNALAIAIRDRLIERWIETQQRYHKQNVKRVYYLSMEFLIGRLLGNNILNLGLWDKVKEAMDDFDLDLDAIPR